MSYSVPFLPQSPTLSIELSVANTAYRLQLNSWPNPPPTGGIRVFAEVTARLHMAWGDGTVEATSNDLPLLQDGVESFALPLSATHVSFISPTGTGRVWVTQGRGL